ALGEGAGGALQLALHIGQGDIDHEGSKAQDWLGRPILPARPSRGRGARIPTAPPVVRFD
ncbi:MAG TPA: hypothetical protein VGL02_19105, partial [Streptomyces sp.]